MIFRHRRAIAWSALVLVAVAAVFALPVFGELGNENDFDDPSAEAVAARNAVNDADGRVQASPSLSRWCGWARTPTAPAAQERIARVAGVLRDPGVASVVAYEPRRRPPAGLARRPLDLPAGDVQERPRGRAAADRGGARRACPG